MRSERRTWTAGTAAAVAVGLLLAGCGGGTDEPAAEDTTAAAEEVDVQAFCESGIEAEALFQAGPELDDQGNPTDEGLQQFREQLSPLIDEFETNAPEQVSEEVQTVVDALRQALETGQPPDSPEFFRADAAIDAFVFENCELANTQEFTGVEYEYNNLPETLPAGQIGLRLNNEGGEVHEAVLLRINDDVDMSVEELLQLPEEEAQGMVEFKGVAFAGPGESGAAVVDLEAGRYAFACFVPVGTTSMDAFLSEGPEGEGTPTASPAGEASPAEEGSPTEAGTEGGEAPPHFTRGMFAEVTVE